MARIIKAIAGKKLLQLQVYDSIKISRRRFPQCFHATHLGEGSANEYEYERTHVLTRRMPLHCYRTRRRKNIIPSTRTATNESSRANKYTRIMCMGTKPGHFVTVSKTITEREPRFTPLSSCTYVVNPLAFLAC